MCVWCLSTLLQVEMDGMLVTQDKLKKGSQEIDKMMVDMNEKKVRIPQKFFFFLYTCIYSVSQI